MLLKSNSIIFVLSNKLTTNSNRSVNSVYNFTIYVFNNYMNVFTDRSASIISVWKKYERQIARRANK